MYHINKSFLDRTGLLANLSSELLFPALKKFAFQFGSEREESNGWVSARQ